MKREEAKAFLTHNALSGFEYDGSSVFNGDSTLNFIDEIYDEFGEKLQDKDDEIELLKHRVEELIKPKTCEGCKHKPNDGECYYEPCGTCARFFYDNYELKTTT